MWHRRRDMYERRRERETWAEWGCVLQFYICAYIEMFRTGEWREDVLDRQTEETRLERETKHFSLSQFRWKRKHICLEMNTRQLIHQRRDCTKEKTGHSFRRHKHIRRCSSQIGPCIDDQSAIQSFLWSASSMERTYSWGSRSIPSVIGRCSSVVASSWSVQWLLSFVHLVRTWSLRSLLHVLSPYSVEDVESCWYDPVSALYPLEWSWNRS